MSGNLIEAVLICGGKYHDMDYARLELLKHLADGKLHSGSDLAIAAGVSRAAWPSLTTLGGMLMSCSSRSHLTER